MKTDALVIGAATAYFLKAMQADCRVLVDQTIDLRRLGWQRVADGAPLPERGII